MLWRNCFVYTYRIDTLVTHKIINLLQPRNISTQYVIHFKTDTCCILVSLIGSSSCVYQYWTDMGTHGHLPCFYAAPNLSQLTAVK